MKTPTLALLNSLGFTNSSQKAVFAAHVLKVATVSSPAIVITPAVPARVAKPEVIAQTAKPARAATAAVVGTANTTGFTFGQLYPNSPAYPAGTPIPAIPAKPASAAVVGVPAVTAAPGIPAVGSPAISAIPGWHDAIEFTKAVDSFKVVAYLPVVSGGAFVGASTGSIDNIKEMTPPALQPTLWIDEVVSVGADPSLTVEPITLEKYFYKHALEIVNAPGSTSKIENAVKVINNVAVACKKVTLNLSATAYTLGVEALQLGKLN